MAEVEGGQAVLVQSDEVDIINHLRDSERLRLRRAKIEEIRTKMREAREREEQEAEDFELKDEKTPLDDEEDDKIEEKKSRLLDLASDIVSAVGNGCKNASGVFRQINKKGKPIFEHISGGKMGYRQINMRGKKAIFKPQRGLTNSVANGVGNACLVAAVVMDAVEIGTAIRQDYEGGTMHNTVHASSGVAGSWAAAVPCAVYGASLGSIVPGAGSLIGGIVGGVVGSLGGGFLARKVAETVMPAPEEKKELEYEESVEDLVIVEPPGQCVICRMELAGFDLFYEHFVESHPDEWLSLFSGVVSRAGEERADIEDTWFVSKAFVSNEEEIEKWCMEDILSFNDRILLSLGWNEVEEEEEEEGWDSSEDEDQREIYADEKAALRREMREYEQGAIEDQQQFHGGLLSVL